MHAYAEKGRNATLHRMQCCSSDSACPEHEDLMRWPMASVSTACLREACAVAEGLLSALADVLARGKLPKRWNILPLSRKCWLCSPPW